MIWPLPFSAALSPVTSPPSHSALATLIFFQIHKHITISYLRASAHTIPLPDTLYPSSADPQLPLILLISVQMSASLRHFPSLSSLVIYSLLNHVCVLYHPCHNQQISSVFVSLLIICLPL